MFYMHLSYQTSIFGKNYSYYIQIFTVVIILIMLYRLRDSWTLRYRGTQRSDDIMQHQQLHERTQANTKCNGQMMQNDDN